MTSITPTFRAEYTDQTGTHPIIWNVKARTNVTGHGKPTEANAEIMRQKLNKSFAPGGVNYHVSKARGYILHVSKVEVIRQSTGAVVATATAPMFEAV